MSVTMRDGVPVVNVRDSHVYGQDPEYAKFYEGLQESAIEAIYETRVADFWNIDAPDIAHDYAYGQVLAHGRSNGWLAVTDPPDLSACDPCYGVEKGEKCADVLRWENFVAEIEQAIEARRQSFREGLEKALTATQAGGDGHADQPAPEWAFIGEIAALTKEGEIVECEGEPIEFERENDDAIDTLGGLIEEARQLLTAKTADDAPTRPPITLVVRMTPENEQAIGTALLGLDYVEEHNDPDSSGVAGEEMADRLVSAENFLRGLLSQAVRQITSDAVSVSEREANFSTGIPPRRGGIAAPKATLDAEAMRGHDPDCRRIPTVGTDNEYDPT